ncbi:MAG TPA: glycosyltransferase [Solirubrobacterales bacterium]|nr:glycosyltransferase [Solirubrobacterales bacterium]
MADDQTVSVVIPCFNQGHYLAEAIESVAAQTRPAAELIVVDDGSQDNSFEVAARYPTVRRLRQDNRGVAAARNAGLELASGSLVVFLDADDRLLPDALRVGVEAIEKRPHIAFAAGMSRDIGEDGSVIRELRQPLVSQDHYLNLLKDCYIWSGSSLVSRRAAVVEVGGFNERLRAGDDYELYLKLARRHPVFCHEEVVTEYRRHGANTTRDSALVLTSQLQVLRGQRSQLRDRREREAQRAGIRNTRAEHGDALAERAREDWRAGRRRGAFSAFRTLACHDPRALLGLAAGSPRRAPAAVVNQGGAS